MAARIVFMGTPAFAVPSLLACVDVGEVVAVVTQPDKPRGRGKALAAPPVKEAALERGLTVLQPHKLRAERFHETLATYEPDVVVVTAYGKILPSDLLEVPRLGCLNVHGSLLPRFRGAAPIQWALLEGDAETGVCLMKMDVGLDTGPVLDRRSLAIEETDTSASLHEKLARLGETLLREALPRYLAGELTAEPQPEEGVVLAPLLTKQDGHLDFTQSAAALARRVRALHPWPGAFTYLGKERLKVLRAEPLGGHGGTPGEAPNGLSDGLPGELLEASSRRLVVACGEGALRIHEVQPEGKRPMGVGPFVAGRALKPGMRPFADSDASGPSTGQIDVGS